MITNNLSRRDLLITIGAALPSAAGCGLLSTTPADKQDGKRPTNSGNKDGQAPILAEQVKAGALPPVEDRLPDKPLVIEPVDRAGSYGGTWTTGMIGIESGWWLYAAIGYDNLVRWSPDWTQVIPNVVDSWERSDDATEFIFHLRPGMKWSDGAPFTADDIIFAYNDFYGDLEVSPSGPPLWLRSDGEPAAFEKVDDVTVRVTFPSPNGLFLENLAAPTGIALTSRPRHHLEQFHKKYNPTVDQLVDGEGFERWAQLLLAKAELWENTDLPTLNAWVLATPTSDGQRVQAERNPYYWKTDPDGSQLPYIDRVEFGIHTADVHLLKASNGELDIPQRNILGPENKPVLARGRERAGYHFYDVTWSIMNYMVIGLNLAHKDPAMREVLQNRDFRVGLSYAINRHEIIDTVYQRQGVPWQAAPRKESDYYHEELATQYTEYDVNKANQHLDEAGYATRDNQGYRVRQDGKRISINVEVALDVIGSPIENLELVQRYWQDVGIEMRIKSEGRSLFYERKAANEHDAAVWKGDGGLQDAILDPRWYMPYNPESNWATAWSEWYNSDGEAGTVPLPEARRQLEIYDQLKATPDRAERRELFMQVLQIAQEQFWVIGTAAPTGAYGLVTNGFHNVPKSMPRSWIYPSPGPTRPEQYFISR